MMPGDIRTPRLLVWRFCIRRVLWYILSYFRGEMFETFNNFAIIWSTGILWIANLCVLFANKGSAFTQNYKTKYAKWSQSNNLQITVQVLMFNLGLSSKINGCEGIFFVALGTWIYIIVEQASQFLPITAFFLTVCGCCFLRFIAPAWRPCCYCIRGRDYSNWLCSLPLYEHHMNWKN